MLSSLTRFSSTRGPMDNDALMRSAPAIFAAAPKSDLSARYSFLPTIEVVEAMRGAGWQPVYAAQGRTRDLDAKGLQRHVIRFAHPDMALRNVGDNRPELVLLNSHDGTSAYQAHAGVFRLVCGNGMIVADSTFDKISVRHTNATIPEIIDASFRVLADVPKIAESIDSMRAVTLSLPEKQIFAEAAAKVRWEEETTPIEPARLLTARRYDDKRDDLYTTLNVVQENIIRGGVRGRSTTGRRMSTRAVASVTEDTKLNKALWHLAEQMRQIKAS